MTIDLLVQKTVVHNFLWIPQSTFPTVPSRVEIESSRFYSQTMTPCSSKIHLLVQKTDVHNFLRIPQSTFTTLPSRVEMESSRFYTQTMTSSSSNIVETFV